MYTPPYDINYSSNSFNNKLFCTFTNGESLDELVKNTFKIYKVTYDKIFSFKIKGSDEYIITYNVNDGNINNIPLNTILVHRKKISNTLYTINALNELIKSLNNGFVDNKFKVNWEDYSDSILLTQHNSLKILNLEINKIYNF